MEPWRTSTLRKYFCKDFDLEPPQAVYSGEMTTLPEIPNNMSWHETVSWKYQVLELKYC